MNRTVLNEIDLATFTFKKHPYVVQIRNFENGHKYHCHIVKEQEFHTCIELLDNRYYWHEGKTDILNTKMRFEFESFLNKPYKGKRKWRNFSQPNNWQALCLLWNEINDMMLIPESIIKRGKRHNYLVIKPNQYSIPKKH